MPLERRERRSRDLPSGERVSVGVFDVHDIERTWMTFTRLNDTNTAQIVSTGDHDDVA